MDDFTAKLLAGLVVFVIVGAVVLATFDSLKGGGFGAFIGVLFFLVFARDCFRTRLARVELS